MQSVARLSNLCISEINSVNLYSFNQERFPMRAKKRIHHGIMYTLEGSETFVFHDKQIQTLPNSIIYLPKNSDYTIHLSSDNVVAITIDFELVSQEINSPFLIKLNSKNIIQNEFINAEKVWKRKFNGYEQLCRSYFYKIIALLIKEESARHSTKNHSKISNAVEYLHKHYTENDFRISALYEISNISPRYFESLFFEEFHTTPKEFVTSLKIKRAKELLLSDCITVSDIAEQLGYSDIYHFSKIFKSKTGYTPSEYKRIHINDI